MFEQKFPYLASLRKSFSSFSKKCPGEALAESTIKDQSRCHRRHSFLACLCRCWSLNCKVWICTTLRKRERLINISLLRSQQTPCSWMNGLILLPFMIFWNLLWKKYKIIFFQLKTKEVSVKSWRTVDVQVCIYAVERGNSRANWCQS